MPKKQLALETDLNVILKNRPSRIKYAENPNADPNYLEEIYKKDNHDTVVEAIIGNPKISDKLITEIYDETFNDDNRRVGKDFTYLFFDSLTYRDEIPQCIKERILRDERMPEFLHEYWSAELISDKEAADACERSIYFLEHFLLNTATSNEYLIQKIFKMYLDLKIEILNEISPQDIFEHIKDLDFPSLELWAPGEEPLGLYEKVENLCVIGFALRESEFLKRSQVEDIENLLRFDEINEFGDFDQKDKFELVDLDSPNGLEYMDGLLAQFKDSVNIHFMPDTEILDHLWDTFDASKELLRTSRHEVLRAFSAQHLDPLSKSDIKEILGDTSIFVRFSATQRETVNNELWQQLSEDESEIVRYGIAVNPSTPQTKIDEMVKDESPLVRLATFRRGQLKAQQLILLTHDLVPAVRQEASEIYSDFKFLALNEEEFLELLPFFDDHSILSILEQALKLHEIKLPRLLDEVMPRIPRRYDLIKSKTIAKLLPTEYLILLAGDPEISVRNYARQYAFGKQKIESVEKRFLEKTTKLLQKGIIVAGTSNIEIWKSAIASDNRILNLAAALNWKYGNSGNNVSIDKIKSLNEFRNLFDVRNRIKGEYSSDVENDENRNRLSHIQLSPNSSHEEILNAIFEEFINQASWILNFHKEEAPLYLVYKFVKEAIEDMEIGIEIDEELIIESWKEYSKKSGKIIASNLDEYWGNKIPHVD